MRKKIKTEEETIQYLSDTNHLRDFILELQEYLKKQIRSYKDDHNQVQYACDCDPHDHDILIRKRYLIRFCNKKRLDWPTVNNMLFDRMSSFLCDYDLIYDLEIDDKGNVLYK